MADCDLRFHHRIIEIMEVVHMSWDDGSKNEDTTSKGREISKNHGDDFFTRGESGNELKKNMG